MDRRVRKLRLKDGRVRIEFERERAGGGWDEFALSSLDEPRRELGGTLQALVVDVLDICQFPDDYAPGLSLTGVSWSYGGDAGTMGAVLIAQKKLKTADAPLNLTTPHLPSAPYSDGAESPTLSAEAVERLDALAEECLRYVDGDRAQGSLFPAAHGPSVIFGDSQAAARERLRATAKALVDSGVSVDVTFGEAP